MTNDNKNLDVHFAKETKVLLNNEPFRFRYDVKGEFGKVETKGLIRRGKYDFRFEINARTSTRFKNEAIMIVRLLKNQSPRVIRIFNQGEVNGIKYLLTTPVGKSLSEILKLFPNLDAHTYVHIMLQTFLCIRDVHFAQSAHFDVQPSSFAIKIDEPKVIIFSSFHISTFLKHVYDNEQESKSKIPPITRYSSRRQHKGDRYGRADDFESWIYMIYEIVHNEPVKWAKIKHPLEMLRKKMTFLKTYSSTTKNIEKKMRYMIDVIFSCNIINAEDVDDLLYKVIIDWYNAATINGKDYPWEELYLAPTQPTHTVVKNSK